MTWTAFVAISVLAAISGPAVSGPAMPGPAGSEPLISAPAVFEPTMSEPSSESASQPAAPIQRDMLTLEDGSGLRYALALPESYDPDRPAPLVLALHFGWGEALPPNYGAIFLEILVEPALRELGAIMVAPNCPARSWADPRSEDAVLALLDHLREQYNVDDDRVIVTGFSLGGMGTWYFASRHPEMFSAAIPMASVPVIATGEVAGRADAQRYRGEGTIEWPAAMLELPYYVIHSRRDELISIEPVESAAAELQAMGATVEFLVVDGIGHHETPRYVPYLQRAVPWVRQVWDSRYATAPPIAMRYLVRARLKDGRAAELAAAIDDGTLGAGSVAGGEYLRNMAAARRLDDGSIRWVEVCFCPSPLLEERPYWEEYFELDKVQDAHDRTRCRDENGTEPWACTDCDCTERLEERLASQGESFAEHLDRRTSAPGE